MRCECGVEIKEHWRFCKECGKPVLREEKKIPGKEEGVMVSLKELEREEKPIVIPSVREGGREPFSSNGGRTLFFVLDEEQDFMFDFKKHLDAFKTAMPAMLDEYYVKTDLQDMEKNKPYGKTELLGHERIFSYQKKWGTQEYVLRIIFNLMHGKFSYYQTKTVKMRKPSLDVAKKIPLLFSDEEPTELPLRHFFFNVGYEGTVYFTGRRFLLLAETTVGDSSEVEKNALKVVLSYWIKPDFSSLFSLLSISGFLVNLIPSGDDERFSEMYNASESMWKKPISEWEKASNHFSDGLEFSAFIVKGKSFENPGLGKLGTFINPVFSGKETLSLRGTLFFVYPKKEEYWGRLLEECVHKARPTDVCDLVAMHGFAREMELKRAASHVGYPVPLEKFKHEV